MINYLSLAAGGAIGTIIRFVLINTTVQYFRSPIFPWGTLIVNLSGSFIIGILAGLNESDLLNPGIRTFLFIGLLGGFTTFSTWIVDSRRLIDARLRREALINVVASLIIGLLAAVAGWAIGAWLGGSTGF